MTARPAHRWTCTSCRLEIRHHPTFHVGLAFCCAGCVVGGPCVCSYDDDIAGDDQALAAPARPAVEDRPPVDDRVPAVAGVD